MIAALIATVVLGAGAYDDAFQRGNTAYEQGDYGTAITAYEQLVAEGVVNADVFYNLGNAYYRANNLGAAIANYERALQVAPRHDAALKNLDFCVAQTQHQWGKPLPPPWQEGLLMWHDNWTPRAVYRLAMLCWFAFWAVLAVRLWKPNKHLTRAAILLALAAAAFATSAYAKFHPPLIAVGTRDNMPVRFGLGGEDATSFELMQGDRVVIDARREGWAQVRTIDGERGWVEESALALVGPPYTRPATEAAPANVQGVG